MSIYSLAALLLVLVSVTNAGQRVCPGYGFIPPQVNCKSTCSMENDECPSDQKCCFRIGQECGFHCIVPKINEPKQGKCPSPSSENSNPNWFLCDGHQCDVDSDCNDAEKCCINTCGAPVCISPQ